MQLKEKKEFFSTSKMFLKITILTSVIVLMECSTESHYITGYNWEKEVQTCWSGGSIEESSNFHVGTLDSVGLKYEDIDGSNTTIISHGRLQIYTKGTGFLRESKMLLKYYSEGSNYKTFSNSWEEIATLGWATQKGRINLDIMIYTDGSIQLTNYVYAYSQMAVTCAETKSHVEAIEIIQTSESRENPLTLRVEVMPKSHGFQNHVSFLLHIMSPLLMIVFCM